MLDAERALARACAGAGLVEEHEADRVADCCRVEEYDLDKILEQGRAVGNPVEPLVRAIRDRVGAEGATAVHLGATSQDVLDTAAMLVATRATDVILADTDRACATCARLAEEHRETWMVGRTLLQQGSPTTFGLKVAGWLVALLDARRCLRAARDELAVQLGGSVGTLAALGAHGPEVVRRFASELELTEPTLPWHTNRVRVAHLGGALGALAGVCGKIGRDVTLLAQTEVGEVAEADVAGRGASSAMPHKRNAVGSVVAVAAARGAADASARLIAGGLHEHERAAGDWHAEWDALSRALLFAGAAAASVREVSEGLDVHPGRMRSNLDALGGVGLAEQAAAMLATRIRRDEAFAIVSAASDRVGTGTTLRDALLEDERVSCLVGTDELDAALDPASALGAVAVLIDRALARFAEEIGRDR